MEMITYLLAALGIDALSLVYFVFRLYALKKEEPENSSRHAHRITNQWIRIFGGVLIGFILLYTLAKEWLKN